MKEFSLLPEALVLQPVTVFDGGACDYCYYWKERTETCEHPGNALEACSVPVNDARGAEGYDNYIFVEVSA